MELERRRGRAALARADSRLPMTHGSMQDFALTLDKFLAHAAKWHPSGRVISAGADGATRTIAYPALLENAKRVSALLAGRGISAGDCVATLAWNSQEHMEAWYGIMGMGAVCHTLNPRLPAEQLAWMIDKSRATILIASDDLESEARLIAQRVSGPAPEIVLLGDGERPPRATLAEMLATEDTTQTWGDFDERTISGLCFTSGTTGHPKGVSYTHRASYLHTLRLLQADVLAITARDVVMPVVPMFHANAWGLPFACPAAGASLVMPGRHADGAHLAALIAAQGVTIAAGVPTVWLGLIDHVDRCGIALPSLRRLMVGGAPMPPALMQRITARGIEVQTTWGMTELSPLGTATPPATPQADPFSSGRPAIGVDLQLTDAAGTPLARQREVEGHLWVRGAAVVDRYFGEAQSSTIDGWFDTGDLARIGSDGALRITGRSKDLIKSGGEWINPAEIEAIISALPCVAQSAVIGRADPKWGERPVLLVEMREGGSVSDAELLGALDGRLAKWSIPSEVIRLDTMPLAPTGKIDKLRLRDQYCRA